MQYLKLIDKIKPSTLLHGTQLQEIRHRHRRRKEVVGFGAGTVGCMAVDHTVPVGTVAGIVEVDIAVKEIVRKVVVVAHPDSTVDLEGSRRNFAL